MNRETANPPNTATRSHKEVFFLKYVYFMSSSSTVKVASLAPDPDTGTNVELIAC